MSGSLIKGHLDSLILAALHARGESHGYAIAEHLRRESGRVFDVPEGTLYPALHRLEDRGLVASSWTSVAGRRRRVYRLTTNGLRAWTAEQRRWDVFARAVDAVLKGTGRRTPFPSAS